MSFPRVGDVRVVRPLVFVVRGAVLGGAGDRQLVVKVGGWKDSLWAYSSSFTRAGLGCFSPSPSFLPLSFLACFVSVLCSVCGVALLVGVVVWWRWEVWGWLSGGEALVCGQISFPFVGPASASLLLFFLSLLSRLPLRPSLLV